MSKMDVCCNERKARMDHKELGEMDYTSKLLTTAIYHALKDCVSFGEYPDDMEFPIIKVAQNHRLTSKNGNDVTYTCNVAFRCAAEILKHKNNTRIIPKYPVHIEDAHKKLAELLADSMASKLQKFESISHIKVEASNGHINFKVTRNDDAGSSAINGLRHIRRSNPVSNTSISTATYVSRQCNGEVHTKRKLEIRTKRSSFDVEEFALYRRYQTIIHHESEDDVTEGAYRRFLVDTPLTFLMPSEYGSAFYGFGSFHQQYLIDEQLVAVGVIDILPSCVSSNYFFWDPDLAFLSLGKYSALREIQLVHDLKLSCPSLEYYYLGHYIHSCPKMHYKVAFRPSELLCPVRMQYVPSHLCPSSLFCVH
jgi:arginine-tRNA-protein transferase